MRLLIYVLMAAVIIVLGIVGYQDNGWLGCVLMTFPSVCIAIAAAPFIQPWKIR